MNKYFLDEFKRFKNYQNFIEYMLSHSDAFSGVYFRYRENEPLKRRTKLIYDQLKPYMLYNKNVMEWPGTITQNAYHHIYRFVLYRADMKCLDTLLLVKKLYEWDYPLAPMDLCFYRNGYCWLETTAHEGYAWLYTDDEEEVKTLESLGANLEFYKEDGKMFCLDKIIK